jgi:acyl-coenzyme A thioesterase PaaI-like protein
MTTTPPELRQVLLGLALNRTPGWNFPGNFLDLSFDEIGADAARLSLEPGPHCIDAGGEVSLGALGVLADIGLAAGMRHQVGLDTRMATVNMALQLTGAPRVGRLESFGRFDGFIDAASGRQGLARSEIRAGGRLIATATGTFMALGNREGTAPLPMRRRGMEAATQPLRPSELAPEEMPVYERAVAAMQGSPGSFIDRFWGYLPRANGSRAECEFANGLHVGNRVGHTQGGLTFALAGVTGAAALSAAWRLTGISAWYVSPGTGATLRAIAEVVHEGRLTAVCRSRVVDGDGRTVLEAMTQHSRAAATPAGNASAG